MCCVEGSPKFTPGDTWPGKGGDQDLLCIVARCVGCPDDMAIRVSEPSTFGKRDVADAVRLSMPGGVDGGKSLPPRDGRRLRADFSLASKGIRNKVIRRDPHGVPWGKSQKNSLN